MDHFDKFSALLRASLAQAIAWGDGVLEPAERYAEELSITVSFQYDQTAAGVAQGMQTMSQSVRQMRSWGL